MCALIRSNADPLLNKGTTTSAHPIRIDCFTECRISFSYISSGHLENSEPEGCRTPTNPLITNHL